MALLWIKCLYIIILQYNFLYNLNYQYNKFNNNTNLIIYNNI